MISTDVLVIGAGPAGSAASSLLARKGRNVLCLEGGQFPRFQIGESLLPRCNDLLEEAGLLEAVISRRYIPKQAALFLENDRTARFSFAEMFPGQRSQTFQVPRADFDQTLATAARKNGADIRFNHRVDAVELVPGGAQVQATDVEGNHRLQISAKWVIDCSGYGRVLPKILKLERESVITPRVAMFTHVEGDLRPEGEAEGDIWICLHPRGAWIWIIPFSNGRTSVGVVAQKALFEEIPGSPREKLFGLLKMDPNAAKRLANARPVMATQKLEAWSAAVDKLHGPGWVLTGNAAEFLDPVFSSGVTLALESASRAVKVVDRELSGEKPDWQQEYVAPVERAIQTFRVFVRTWYTGELPRVLMQQTKTDMIKRAITAVLGGYVLDENNPFVRDGEGMLRSLLKLA